MKQGLEGEPVHPMRLVERRTGLGADLLRAWERRYGAVHPARSAGGQRLYRDSDIDRLVLLRRLTEAGHAISRVATLPTGELRALVSGDRVTADRQLAPAITGQDGSSLERAIQAVDDLDDQRLESLLRAAFAELGVVGAVEQRFIPLLRLIGERWVAGTLGPAQEHLASDVIVRTLHWMRDSSVVNHQGMRILFATTQGERHEMGIQAAATIAAASGWRVVFLGADLPVESIVEAAAEFRPRVLALSLVAAEGTKKGLEAILNLRSLLADDCLVMVGGAGAGSIAVELARAGVEVLTNTTDFRLRLAELEGSG